MRKALVIWWNSELGTVEVDPRGLSIFEVNGLIDLAAQQTEQDYPTVSWAEPGSDEDIVPATETTEEDL